MVLEECLEKGRGKVIIRSKYEIIEDKKTKQILVHEIPFEVNKQLLVKNKTVDGLEFIIDDINQNGVDAIQDLYVKFNQEADNDPSLMDEAREWVKAHQPEILEKYNEYKSDRILCCG